MERKTTAIIACFLILLAAITGNVLAGAPNSGDGIPDGSGYVSPNGPNGEECPGNGNGEPAPNSGDGIPDGPGWP